MEIDLDNLVFNGLDEAEERNAERLDDADKKSAGDCRRRRLRRRLQDLIKSTGFPVLFFISLVKRHAHLVPVRFARAAQFSVTFYHGTLRVNVGNVDAIQAGDRQD